MSDKMRITTALLLLLLCACDRRGHGPTTAGADAPAAATQSCSELRKFNAPTPCDSEKQEKLDRCFNAPDVEASVAICTRSIEELPEGLWRATALYGRGDLHLLFDHNGAAIADANTGIAQAPQFGHLWMLRARAHLQMGKDELAGPDLVEALRLAPDFGLLAHVHAGFLSRRGDHVQALAEIDRAMPLLAEQDPLYVPAALTRRCRIRADLGIELDVALEDCEAGWRGMEGKARGSPHFARGLVLYRLGRYADAAADFDQSIVLEGKSGPRIHMRGLARRALGDTAAGDADIAESLRLEPEVEQRYASYRDQDPKRFK